MCNDIYAAFTDSRCQDQHNVVIKSCCQNEFTIKFFFLLLLTTFLKKFFSHSIDVDDFLIASRVTLYGRVKITRLLVVEHRRL